MRGLCRGGDSPGGGGTCSVLCGNPPLHRAGHQSAFIAGLRAIAVLWAVQFTTAVVQGHFVLAGHRTVVLHEFETGFATLTNGFLAVEILLVLSGFLFGARVFQQVRPRAVTGYARVLDALRVVAVAGPAMHSPAACFATRFAAENQQRSVGRAMGSAPVAGPLGAAGSHDHLHMRGRCHGDAHGCAHVCLPLVFAGGGALLPGKHSH